MKTLLKSILPLVMVLFSITEILAQGNPSITCNGACLIILRPHQAYAEPGYSARDSAGNVANNAVVVTGSVDTSKEGRNELEYCITSGGITKCAERIVLISKYGYSNPGDNTILDSIHVPPGFRQDTLNKIVDYFTALLVQPPKERNLGGIDSNKVGIYYFADSMFDYYCGIIAILIKVAVEDKIKPYVALNGADTICVQLNASFIDPGVKDSDSYWPSPTLSMIRKGNVNINLSGFYKITYIVTDPSGNSDSVSRIVKVGACLTGIAERSKPSDLRIYPNPFSDLLSIERAGLEGIQFIRIFDDLGKLVKEVQVGNKQESLFQISTSDLREGIYLIRIESNTDQFVQKLVLNR